MLSEKFGPMVDKIAMEGSDTLVAFCIATEPMVTLHSRVSPEIQSMIVDRQVEAWRKMAKTMPGMNVRIVMWVDGYDDDPRELWDTPEVVAFVKEWVKRARVLDDMRLLPTARAFLRALGADPDARAEAYRPTPRPPGPHQ
jgi:hypothetical protein